MNNDLICLLFIYLLFMYTLYCNYKYNTQDCRRKNIKKKLRWVRLNNLDIVILGPSFKS